MTINYVTYPGPYTLDLAPVQDKLIDIEEGGMQGLRPDLPGFHVLIADLAETIPKHGPQAGIPQDVYDHFLSCNQTVAQIDELLLIARKQVEVLQESRAYYVDARQNDISLMVDIMKTRAQRRKDFTILVPFETLLKYRSQIGDKAHRTRRKNLAAKAEAEAPQAPPAPAEPAAPGDSPASPA